MRLDYQFNTSATDAHEAFADPELQTRMQQNIRQQALAGLIDDMGVAATPSSQGFKTDIIGHSDNHFDRNTGVASGSLEYDIKLHAPAAITPGEAITAMRDDLAAYCAEDIANAWMKDQANSQGLESQQNNLSAFR